MISVMAAFVIATTPAGASSLAYVKDGAVWVSAPDGSDAHQVGTGLTFPALADDGTVYALSGDAQVAVLPPGVPEQPAIAIYGAGASELSVSPDGGELAWRDVQFGLNDLQHGVSAQRVSDGRRTDILSDEWPVWFSDTEMTMGGPNGGDQFDALTDEEHQAIWPDEYTTAYDTSINQYSIDHSGTRGAANMDITTGGGPPRWIRTRIRWWSSRYRPRYRLSPPGSSAYWTARRPTRLDQRSDLVARRLGAGLAGARWHPRGQRAIDHHLF